jgi:hypothetical protein
MVIGIALLLLNSQSPGVSPEWDTRAQAQRLAQEILPLKTMLAQLDPDRWLAAGAPASLEQRRKRALAEVDALQQSAQDLSSEPLRLGLAVDTLDRLDTVLLESHWLAHAVRKYQNPAMADVMEAALEPFERTRNGLRQHVIELAVTREKELEVAERELQSCREKLLRPAPRPGRPEGK